MKKIIFTFLFLFIICSFSFGQTNIKVIGVIQNAHDNPNNSPGLIVVAKVIGMYPITQVELWWDNLDDIYPPGPLPGFFSQVGTSYYYFINVNSALIGSFNSGDRIRWRIRAKDNQNNWYYYPPHQVPLLNDTTKVYSYGDLNSNLKIIKGRQGFVNGFVINNNTVTICNNKAIYLFFKQLDGKNFQIDGDPFAGSKILSSKTFPFDFFDPPSIDVNGLIDLPMNDSLRIMFSKIGSDVYYFPLILDFIDFLASIADIKNDLLTKDQSAYLAFYSIIKDIILPTIQDPSFNSLTFSDQMLSLSLTIASGIRDNGQFYFSLLVTELTKLGFEQVLAQTLIKNLFKSLIPIAGGISKGISLINASLSVMDFVLPPIGEDTIRIKKSRGHFCEVERVTMPGVNNPMMVGNSSNFALLIKNKSNQKLYNVWLGLDILAYNYNLNKYVKVENTKTDFVDPETGQIGLIDFGLNQGRDINVSESKLYISNNYTFNNSVTNYSYKASIKPYKYHYTVWSNGQPGQGSPVEAVDISSEIDPVPFYLRDNITPLAPVLFKLDELEMDSTSFVYWQVNSQDTMDTKKIYIYSNSVCKDSLDYSRVKGSSIFKNNNSQNIQIKIKDIGGLISSLSNTIQIERISLYPTVNIYTPKYDSLITTATPLLDWSDAPSPINYQVQISTDSIFNVITFTNNVTTSQQIVPPGILTSNQKYYWRVRVNYAGNNTSRWSLSYRFRTPNFIANIPQLLLPSNGATGVSLTPLMQWTGPLMNLLIQKGPIDLNSKENEGIFTDYITPGYWLQISSNANFNSPEINIIGISDTSYQVLSGLIGNTLYRWRVKASNINGDTSAWSTIFTFTTISGGQIPPQPRLISPANNATNVSLTPMLDWNDTTNVTNYQIQVSTNQNFSTFALNVSVPATPSQYNVSSGVLTGNTTYYWHVRGINSYGNGMWSIPFSFTTASGGCIPPSLISPFNNSTGHSVTPLLDWSDVSGATSYQVQLDINISFNNPIINNITSASQFQVLSNHNLLVNTTYYWRVGTICGGQGSIFAGPYSFTTGTYQIPNRPFLMSPTDGATGQQLDVPFHWSPVTNATTYTIEFGNDSSYNPALFAVSGITGGISGMEWIPQPGMLSYFTTYYWHLKAVNNLGDGPWSWSRHFTTLQINNPDPPQLISPDNNSVNQPLTPTLVWSPVSGANNYHVQLTKFSNINFDSCIIDWNVGNVTQYQYLIGLNNNQTYKWRVYSTNGSLNSIWSNIYVFSTITASSPPSTPALSAPANNLTGVSLTPTFIWGNIPAASTYGIQVALDSSFTQRVFDQTGIVQTQISLPSNLNLSYLTKYYWHVNASNQAGTSLWSTKWNFTTLSQPIIAPPINTQIIGIGQIFDIKQENQYLYCLSESGFYRINIDDPANPFIKNSVALPTGIGFYQPLTNRHVSTRFEISNGYAFIGNGTSGLTIIDISNFNSLQIVKTLSNAGCVTNVAIKDSILYALDFSSYQSKYINVINIKNPLSPFLVKTFDGSHGNLLTVFSIIRVNNYLYCSSRYGNIYWWNLTNSSNPSYSSSTHNPYNSDFVRTYYNANRSYLYLEDWSPPNVFTYSVNTTTGGLNFINQLNPSGNPVTPTTIAELNNTLYITSFADDFQYMYDNTNPAAPTPLNNISPAVNDFNNAFGIYLNSSYCYLGCQGQLLTFPLRGTGVIGRIDQRGSFSDVKIKDNYLYAAAGNRGLIVFDISNKAHPYQIANVTNSQPNKIYIDSTNFLYSITTTNVYIYNIATPSNPILLSNFRIPYKITGSNDYCNINDILVKNNIGYTFFMYRNGYSAPSLEEKGMATIDLSNKYNPVLLSKFYFDNNSREVSAILLNNDLYSVERRYHLDDVNGYGGINRLVHYSLSNPTNPSMTKYQDISDYPEDFANADSSFYVITGASWGEPCNATIKYIKNNNFNIYKNIILDYTPSYLTVPNNYIYITKGGNFEIHSKDTSFSLIESLNFIPAPGKFILDSPYVHSCNNLVMNTFKLNFPVTAPAKVNLISPGNGTNGQILTPTLNWGIVTGATSYYLQVSKHLNFDTLIINYSNWNSNYYNISNGYLIYNTLYYWRVAAINDGGSGPWSDTWNFRTQLKPPNPPILLNPPNNSLILTLTPTLSWNDSLIFDNIKLNSSSILTEMILDTTISYRIQVASANIIDKRSMIIDSSGLISKQFSIQTGKLSFNTQYYWRVKSYIGQIEGDWSNLWAFTTMPNAPNAPVLSQPVNGSINQPTNITFKWYKSIETLSLSQRSNIKGQTLKGSRLTSDLSTLVVSNYWFEYSTDSTFATGVIRDSTLTDTTKTVSGLSNITKYFWRVKAMNQGGWGSFSSVWNFTTIVPVPAIPVLLIPINNSIDISVTPTLDWNDVTYSASYRVQISTSSAFATTIYDTAGLTVSQITVPSGILSTNASYYWRVNATNVAGTGSYSTIWNFTTAPNVPNVPLLSQPMNGATGQPINITFKWYKAIETLITGIHGSPKNTKSKIESIDEFTINKYWLEYSADSAFIIGVERDTSLTDTTKYVTGLANITKYYWRVKAKNQTGWGNFCAYWNFTTIVPIPATPTLITPANGATGIILTPLLDWNDVTYATSYRFQISTDSLFGSTQWDTSGITVSQATVPLGKLTGLTKYYWRVNAANVSGTGAWSLVWNFTTLQNLSINLKVYLEGFWDGTSQITDTARIYLANSITPYVFVDSATVIMSTTGTSVPLFTKTANGSYYIAIKHRNHLETWSKLPQLFVTGITVNYDFTTAANKAFGDNMKQVGSVWVFFGGDPNQDGEISAVDIPIFISEFGLTGGYFSCDFNGDGEVNAMDVQIIATNFGLTKAVPMLDNNNDNRNMQKQNKGRIR